MAKIRAAQRHAHSTRVQQVLVDVCRGRAGLAEERGSAEAVARSGVNNEPVRGILVAIILEMFTKGGESMNA